MLRGGKVTSVCVRLDDKQLVEIDALVELLGEETPEISVNRSHVLRVALAALAKEKGL